MNERKYFIYDPDYGFELFETEEDRDAKLPDCIARYMEHERSGVVFWDDEVTDIRTGIITHRVNEGDLK